MSRALSLLQVRKYLHEQFEDACSSWAVTWAAMASGTLDAISQAKTSSLVCSTTNLDARICDAMFLDKFRLCLQYYDGLIMMDYVFGGIVENILSQSVTGSTP